MSQLLMLAFFSTLIATSWSGPSTAVFWQVQGDPKKKRKLLKNQTKI
jgi:hypothetical protein